MMLVVVDLREEPAAEQAAFAEAILQPEWAECRICILDQRSRRKTVSTITTAECAPAEFTVRAKTYCRPWAVQQYSPKFEMHVTSERRREV